MEKKKFILDDHFYGRIFLGLAIILIILVPVIMCIVLETLPNFLTIAQCIFPLITFIIGGFVEVITYSPMLGVSGTYLGFFTGNLVNLKVPCAVNAREQAGVKHGSKEGEIISTISVAISTLVTTVILALGVALLIPLKPVLQNPYLIPAFDAAFTALFGALAYKYFIKDLKLVPVPLIIAFILSFFLGQNTGITIPVCAIIAILFSYFLFKREQNKIK
jgi:hypothetical protein